MPSIVWGRHPQETITSGLAVLADLIIQAAECLSASGSLAENEIESAWTGALELHTCPGDFRQDEI